MMKLDPTLAIAQSAPKISHSSSDAELKKQTDAFESIILKSMLDMALKLDDPLYGKGTGSEIYESMYKDQLSKQLTGAFGYSELLFKYLKGLEKSGHQ